MADLLAPPEYGTSLHWPSCIGRACTGCLPPDSRPAVGVTGFGRCGSSMTMAMLVAGGMTPADNTSPPSYELTGGIERAYGMPLAGRAIKLLDAIQHYGLPDAPSWRFVWLDRDPIEQAKSTLKLMATLGHEFVDDAVERLVRSFEADRPRILGGLRDRGEVLVMQYERVLANPRKAAKQLRQVFPPLDVDAAAAVVHRRDGKCREGLMVELGGQP